MNALILVDLQNDFLPGGALPVPEGDAVIPVANELQPSFDLVVATQDWHPANHGSFAANHPGRKPGDVIELSGLRQILWPAHCVQNTPGAALAPGLDTRRVARIFQKGAEPDLDSYSGFFDNGHRRATGLADYLKAQGVTDVFIAGLATDYCVSFTALDAVQLGFETTVIADACRGVNLQPGDAARALAQLKQAGVRVVTSGEIRDSRRVETDSMGEMRVPADALYGAQTARAVENFPVSHLRFSRGFIRALALIKKHAAATNAELGLIEPRLAGAIQAAAQEVADGRLDRQFVVDVFQTGSGTSTNMNANEVIANRAAQLLGGKPGDKSVHPNDHVNLGQSSNDAIPSAIHLAALAGLEFELVPALEELRRVLAEKAAAFRDVIKIGRTHLQDATPMRLGQEFSGYAAQVAHGIARLKSVRERLGELALGGTAVGTGLNTHPEFAMRTIRRLAEETRLPLREAANHFEAQAARDACVETAGALKTVAVSLIKIANDIRYLGSGPRGGLGELKLPATQPGSSIMPGKVNPVMCEMVIQVGAQVMGNDAVVAFSGAFGQLELNTMLPVLAYNLLQAIELLARAAELFSRRCVAGLEADAGRCAANVEQSLALVTALAPVIGHDRAAQIARRAYETGRTIREVAQELSGLDRARLDELLDPRKQAGSAE